MARKPSQRSRVPERAMTPDRAQRFAWNADDVHITYPSTTNAASGLPDELHTILWSLEHVSNQASLDEVMPNVASYLIDHPGDPLIAVALQRVEQRLEHAT